MTRVKRGVIKQKKRRNLLKTTKGYRFGRSTKEAQARDATYHAGAYAFAHRRDKKNDFRKLWNVKISAASVSLGISYSKLIVALKKQNIELDRKILAQIAMESPETFSRLLSKVK